MKHYVSCWKPGERTVMDTIAMWIGYAAMRIWHHGWNMGDILDATAEWRRAHPEKFARWKKRNGVDEDA